MSSFFSIGEQKTRPGVYFRYENVGNPPLAGADDGRCAAVFRSNWGPLGEATLFEGFEDIAKVYGNGGVGGTTKVPFEQFRGGARSVYGVRLGSGGTNGTYTIDAGGTDAVLLTLKYPGSRALNVTIRPTLDDPNVSELLILEGTTSLERLTFPNVNGQSNVDALMAAFASAGSNFFILTKIITEENTSPITTITQQAITGGTDPASYTNADYSAAFEVLEAYRWNVLAIDTDDNATQALMQMFLSRIYQSGQFTMGVVGEPTTVDFETRLLHAGAYNSYQMVYVGNGFIDSTGEVCEGYLAAARIAGLIAATPSNQSITHLVMTGAVGLSETLTNSRHESAIRGGMLTFSLNPYGNVWVDEGINTLVVPGTEEDAGWKKIKRVKVRFELFQRLNDTVEMLIGRVNNDDDGRATIIQTSNGVCNAMVTDDKLLPGAFVELDRTNPPVGDSVWFTVHADDLDAVEKLYYTFRFRFAPDAAT